MMISKYGKMKDQRSARLPCACRLPPPFAKKYMTVQFDWSFVGSKLTCWTIERSVVGTVTQLCYYHRPHSILGAMQLCDPKKRTLPRRPVTCKNKVAASSCCWRCDLVWKANECVIVTNQFRSLKKLAALVKLTICLLYANNIYYLSLHLSAISILCTACHTILFAFASWFERCYPWAAALI